MLTHNDLYTLEEYSRVRPEFKEMAVGHRKSRQVKVGKHMTLHFEDSTTIRYQIQEMLLIERTFSVDGIQDELDAYNPLLPTGKNLKATLTIEYSNPSVRAQKLEELCRVEDRVYVQARGHDPVYAISDEDMDRSNDTKTAAVHFLRFELTDSMIHDLKNNGQLRVGVDHPGYTESTEVTESTLSQLIKDLSQ